MPTEEVEKRKAVGRVLFGFALEIYDLQLKAGRHFLLEHPATATSWQEPGMQDLCSRPGVSVMVGDQCRYGLQARGKDGVPGPAMKPTKFASSAIEVLRELGQRCKRNHEHVPFVSGRAAAAAVYPPGLCRAILKGIDRQQRREGQHTPARVAQAVEDGTGIYELGRREGSDAAMNVATRTLSCCTTAPWPRSGRRRRRESAGMQIPASHCPSAWPEQRAEKSSTS